MKKSYRWDNLSWPEIKELSDDNAVVLLPVGSIEQHGPHLPTGTDTFLSTYISEIVAQKLNEKNIKCIVAPSLTVCNSIHHMQFCGSMTLTPNTFMQVALEYCQCIASHGFRKIVFINGHGGNDTPLKTALITINNTLGFPVFLMDYYDYPNLKEINSGILTTQNEMIHACEAETSLMLEYDKSLVRDVYKETKTGVEDKTLSSVKGIYTFHKMKYETDNGVEGNPYAATEDKGEKLISVITNNIINVLTQEDLWKVTI